MNRRSKQIQKVPRDEKKVEERRVKKKVTVDAKAIDGKKEKAKRKTKSVPATQNGGDDLFFAAKRNYLEEEEASSKSGKQRISKGDEMFFDKVMKSGTITDKISGLSLLIRENSKYPLKNLQALIELTKTAKKRQLLIVLDSLKMLFLEVLLPDRKLEYFAAQIAKYPTPSKSQLSEMFKENALKELYEFFIRKLQQGTTDPLNFYKEKCIDILAELLIAKTEKEGEILSILVNKFGDSDKTIVTYLARSLHKILMRHNKMTIVICKEIENFILRQNLSMGAAFYAVNFINSINFTALDFATLSNIFDIQIRVMKKQLTQEPVDSKVLNVLLRGINRIFPLLARNDSKFVSAFEEKIDRFYEMAHTSPMKVRIQTMTLIFQILKTQGDISDRFFRVLYEMLLDAEIKDSSVCEQFLDLLFTCLKADHSLQRAKAFIKRLFQLSLHAEPPFIIAALIFFYRLLDIHKGLKTLLTFKESGEVEDDEERFVDVQESDEEEVAKPTKQERGPSKEKGKRSDLYDPFKREPLFSGVDSTCLWEITLLTSHFHPTVRKFTNILIGKERGKIEYQGNPFLDFSMANFLDRIELKKTRKKKSTGFIKLALKNRVRISKLEDALTTEEMLKKNKAKVRSNEAFFVRYFEQRQKRKETQQNKKSAMDIEEADVDEFADELFAKELEKGEVLNDDEFFAEMEEGAQDEEEVQEDDMTEFTEMLDNFGDADNEEGYDQE